MISLLSRFKRCMSTGLTLGLVFGAIGTASASGADHGEAGFNPSEFIIHHIQDAHEIHIIGDVHIPLPVIAYAPESGQFDTFLSSALHHGAHHGSSGLWYTMDHGTLIAHDHDPSGHNHGAHDHSDHSDDHAEGGTPRRTTPDTITAPITPVVSKSSTCPSPRASSACSS